jgi:hypothetical protein
MAYIFGRASKDEIAALRTRGYEITELTTLSDYQGMEKFYGDPIEIGINNTNDPDSVDIQVYINDDIFNIINSTTGYRMF